jgi:hypothetical protein
VEIGGNVITANAECYQQFREGAEVLEADGHGEKVLRLVDGNILKLFRRKRRISSASWRPYAIRFADNCGKLSALGIPCPGVVAVYRFPDIARDGVLYHPLPGKTIRQLLKAGLFPDESRRLRDAVLAFVTQIQNQGVYFRSLHLGNVVLTPEGRLGLIDVADMAVTRVPLGYFSAIANICIGIPKTLPGFSDDIGGVSSDFTAERTRCNLFPEPETAGAQE